MCSKVCCTWKVPSDICSKTTVLKCLFGMQRKKDLPANSVQAWQWPSDRMGKGCFGWHPRPSRRLVLCSNASATTSAMLFFAGRLNKDQLEHGKQNDKQKRKPRRRTCRHIDTWLAYLLGVRLVHCLRWLEEHRQPHKNSEQCTVWSPLRHRPPKELRSTRWQGKRWTQLSHHTVKLEMQEVIKKPVDLQTCSGLYSVLIMIRLVLRS